MVARVSIYENVDLAMADRIKHWIDTFDADPFGELPGYRGSMTLVDRDNARLVGIGFYATVGQAREADALLTTMPEHVRDRVPEDIRPALDMRADSPGDGGRREAPCDGEHGNSERPRSEGGRDYALPMAKGKKRPPGSEPFDVTLPDGFEPGAHGADLAAAAKASGWTIERDGATVVVRDVWTDNQDHAAWLVASKVGLPLERVTVWAGRAE